MDVSPIDAYFIICFDKKGNLYGRKLVIKKFYMSAERYDGENIILIDFKFNEFVVGQYFVFLRFFLPFPIV